MGLLAISGQPRGFGSGSQRKVRRRLTGLGGCRRRSIAALFVTGDLRDISPVPGDDSFAKHGIVFVLFETGGRRLAIPAVGLRPFGVAVADYCCGCANKSDSGRIQDVEK